MKKFIAVLFVISMAGVLAACGSTKKKEPAEATTEDPLLGGQMEIHPVELDAAEYVELGKYKGLTVDVEKREITDEDVEEEIQNYLHGYAQYKEIKGRDTVQEGDFVNMNYTCTIDGVESDDYSDTDVDVQAGDGQLDEYLGTGLGEEFQIEKKVIGSKVGSDVNAEFTFPEDYDDEAVAGKTCSMTVHINSISEEEIPKLDEAFVKEYTESASVDEYRKDTKASLEEQAQSECDDRAREELWKAIVDQAKLKKDFTDDMIKQEMDNVKAESQEVAELYYGMGVEEYIREIADMTVQEYAEFSLKSQCVQDLLIKEEKISLTDNEFKTEMGKIAEESGFDTVDEMKEYYSEEDIRDTLIRDKLYEKLSSYNKINVVPAKDEDVEETTEAAKEDTKEETKEETKKETKEDSKKDAE